MSNDLALTLAVAGRYRQRAKSIRSTDPSSYDHLRAANDEAVAAMLEGLAAEVRALREAAHVGVEFDNHHNAWLCPFCVHPDKIDAPVTPSGDTP